MSSPQAENGPQGDKPKVTVNGLREKYLRFFASKGHVIHPSGSLIPYDVTGKLDESLLFNGAGMIQFKPYFRGTATPENPRLTTAQKCVRTGDIEEVGDNSHLTFFEMMGNFSFGDYFASQAIAFSWEFMTSPEWLGLDPNRLAFTVFESDEEAYTEWSGWLRGAGLTPEERIFRLGEETNYWPAGAFSNGPPGPCGPNSEMFYWVSEEPCPSGNYTREDFLRDEGAGKWLEFWNDVFIQYEWRGHLRNPDRPADGYEKDELAPLPFRSIDTGMGLERAAVVLSGGAYKDVFMTDAFESLIDAIKRLFEAAPGKDKKIDTQTIRPVRIIADHLRTACFCIADGVLPGNNGRGYVLRRLIRRAVLAGSQKLKIEEAFLSGLVPVIVENMGRHYTELVERQSMIEEMLRNEEELFRRTLRSGLVRFGELGIQPGDVIAGDEAFKLYDTHGFPLEVTSELAAEAGATVDLEGYEAAMREAQERSRAGQERQTVYGGVEGDPFGTLAPSLFEGYHVTEAHACVVGVDRSADTAQVALDRTPFYAASGGQVADNGVLKLAEAEFQISGVTKRNGVYIHSIGAEVDVNVGQMVELRVNGERRRAIERNHTATHVLHAALRSVLGTHVTQAGSYVGPDRLRFDFTHGQAVGQDELARIERIVNQQVLANTPVTTYVDLPIDEARAMGAMALFGEKYGDKVRMVEIVAPELEFASRELCGGTHVRQTGTIGLFKVISESSASSGVRRIEAITGEVAYDWALEETERLREAAALLKSSPKDLVAAIEKAVETQRDLKQKLEKARTQTAADTATVTDLGKFELATELLTEGEAADASRAADRLVDGHPRRIVVVALLGGGKVTFVAKSGAEAQANGAHAGNLVRELAKLTGGGGGGGPAFATAGGRQPEKAAEALAAIPTLLG